MGGAYVDGAAHHGAAVQGLLHDSVQVVGGVLGLVLLSDASSEVLHGLHRGAAFQSLVAPVQPEMYRNIV